MGLATVVGGYGGAWVAQEVAQAWVRRFVTVIGALMTAYFFAGMHRPASGFRRIGRSVTPLPKPSLNHERSIREHHELKR